MVSLTRTAHWIETRLHNLTTSRKDRNSQHRTEEKKTRRYSEALGEIMRNEEMMHTIQRGMINPPVRNYNQLLQARDRLIRDYTEELGKAPRELRLIGQESFMRFIGQVTEFWGTKTNYLKAPDYDEAVIAGVVAYHRKQLNEITSARAA